VLQFYAAITKFHASRPLLSLIPRFLRPVPASIYDLVRKILRSGSKALLVSLLHCLYEAQDTDLCKYVGEQLRDKMAFVNDSGRSNYCKMLDLSRESLLPQDWRSTGYYLASIAVGYKGKFAVNLESCSLGDTGIKILMQSLCRSLGPHSEITGHLHVYIGNNEITGVGAAHIAEALRTTRALRGVYFYSSSSKKGNKIGDTGLQYIAEAMTINLSLFELDLRWCSLRITEENCPALTEMLQKNKTLKILHLAHNEIGVGSVSFIIEGLQDFTLETLNLTGCGITNEHIHSIQNSTSTCKIVYDIHPSSQRLLKDHRVGIYS
jgi:hypothetical protein